MYKRSPDGMAIMVDMVEVPNTTSVRAGTMDIVCVQIGADSLKLTVGQADTLRDLLVSQLGQGPSTSRP